MTNSAILPTNRAARIRVVRAFTGRWLLPNPGCW
jgi:hypothetical protein